MIVIYEQGGAHLVTNIDSLEQIEGGLLGENVTKYMEVLGDKVPQGLEVVDADYSAGTWQDPVPVVTADDVRHQCARRITDVYPKFRQINDAHTLSKPYGSGLPSLTALVDGGLASAQQQGEYDTIIARIKIKDDLIACSNLMEQDPPSDYENDARWVRSNWDDAGVFTG
jgi:hypothetical protein